MNPLLRIFFGLIAVSAFFHTLPAYSALTVQSLDDNVYAKVAGKTINLADYQQALHNAVRNKFYHGKIPEGKMREVQRDTGKELVSNILLLEEAKRRGIKPDKEWIDASIKSTVAKLEKQYGQSEKWEENRKRVITGLSKQLQTKSLIKQLEDQVRNVKPASDNVLKAYYKSNKEKFTSPEQVRVLAILLKVDPSSPVVVWDEAMEEGRRLYKQLQKGADFAELAKLHSADKSAEKGGDMGYLHKGMLAPQVQENLDKMKPGELTKPMKILQGVAVFKLMDRIPPKLNSFEKVKERAGNLWLREKKEELWQALITKLWDASEVVINEKYYKTEKAEDKKMTTGVANSK